MKPGLDLPDAEQCRQRGSLKWSPISSDHSPADTSPADLAEPPSPALLGAWVAEMDYAPAPAIQETLKRAVSDNLLGYCPPWAKDHALAAMCEYQKDRFGWEVRPEQCGLAGSVLGIFRALLSTLPPDSTVIVPTPAYMPFLSMPTRAGHRVLQVPSPRKGSNSDDPGRWLLDLSAIEAALNAADPEGEGSLLVLCNPWNPVGQCLREEELMDLAQVVEKYPRALVFNDEIHSPLSFAAPHIPFMSLGGAEGRPVNAQTVTATAASKAWNIAGLHCAQWIITDPSLRERLAPAFEFLTYEALFLGCLATTAAYRDSREYLDLVLGQLEENVARVRGWYRELLAARGPEFARELCLSLPEGTYLSWWENPSRSLGPSPAERLAELGLKVNDGRELGEGYENCFRLNLACSPAVLEEILRVIERAFSGE